eukprot:88547_1
MSTYTWKITDPSLVRSMKNAKFKSYWKSPVFSFGGFKWYLNVYPNGNKRNSNGYVELFLQLAFLPPKVKALQIQQKLRLVETDTIKSSTDTYEKGDMGWGLTILQTEKLQ